MDLRTKKLLLDLTSLPTATGCEDRVVEYVEQWVRRRKGVTLNRDEHGNVLLKPRGARSNSPVVFEAHMDHPAFVVDHVDGREVGAEFRGGVRESFFAGSRVHAHRKGRKPVVGRIIEVEKHNRPHSKLRATVRFGAAPEVEVGDPLTWALPPARSRHGRLIAPACDNLAGVAGALAAFDAVRRGNAKLPGVWVLLTRGEEVGFLGAIGACRSRTIPRRARLIVLENSRSFDDSPIGGGPIVRVGDKTSTFDPDLTYRLGRIAAQLAERDKDFRWQRKLMPGGTCEASAFGAFGFAAACLCLPLGNYHNMNERTGRIDSEMISPADFDGLVKLLIESARRLDSPDGQPPLKDRLADHFKRSRRLVLG